MTAGEFDAVVDKAWLMCRQARIKWCTGGNVKKEIQEITDYLNSQDYAFRLKNSSKIHVCKAP